MDELRERNRPFRPLLRHFGAAVTVLVLGLVGWTGLVCLVTLAIGRGIRTEVMVVYSVFILLKALLPQLLLAFGLYAASLKARIAVGDSQQKVTGDPVQVRLWHPGWALVCLVVSGAGVALLLLPRPIFSLPAVVYDGSLHALRTILEMSAALVAASGVGAWALRRLGWQG